MTATSTEIPAIAGLSFKPQHAEQVLARNTEPLWFEIHAENYMTAGGPRKKVLDALSLNYPLSLHGVGLSLGGGDALNRDHLNRVKALVDTYQPGLISEHIAWSTHNGGYFADLFPPLLTRNSLELLIHKIEQIQDHLSTQILIENPASYLQISCDSIPEHEYIVEVAKRSGCKLLIDVTNIFISAHNIGINAHQYIESIPEHLVGEYHLSGYTRDARNSEILIDSHSRAVPDDVWHLFQHALNIIGPRPTLIEWDDDIPTWEIFYAEALRANQALKSVGKSYGG
ncbi:MNIO family bufferin maturase [Thalassospira xiamenensis]|uniref:Uncharacterized protein n=1 Tax=Thalassospira xiamenensis TaxID=220697 RepID=A0A285U258_9PROT|nr:DUF692 domain-containing protein [Thalassospira xiamenensis]SOC31035.1 hypothetical protein SAMN05428964_11213 [Thalassospira xiamenensis]